MRHRRRLRHTYIEVSGTVKTLLIRHHAKRETDHKRGKGQKKVHRSGGGMSKERKEEGVIAPPCGQCRKQQTRVTIGERGGGRKKWQTDCERQREKKDG